ncbi:MAG: hypothetical protein K8S97_10205, partial [Anaerolineae bacterium]|nr:hypothetical protein [Anaerolineae bacterium]
QGETVLAPADRDQYAFVTRKHALFFDDVLRALVDPRDEVCVAERQFMLPHVDHGFGAAVAAQYRPVRATFGH